MTVPASSARRAQGGFTLMELLLATAVGAVVLLVIQTTFFGALRLSNTTHEHIDEDLVLQRALGIVRRDFSGIMMPGGPLSGQLQTTNFSSSTNGSFGDRVSPDIFTTSGKIDGWNPFSEAQMVAYYLSGTSDGRSGRDLVRVVTRNLLPVQESVPEDQIILPNVASATVSFYDGTGWTDTWDSTVTSTLPTALKLSLVLAPRVATQATPAPIELIVPVLVVTTTQAREAENPEP